MNDFYEIQLDQEAVDFAYTSINYYSNLPRHIRGRVLEFKDVRPNDDSLKAAHVVDGAITVKGGKLNMPVLNYPNCFVRHTSFLNPTN